MCADPRVRPPRHVTSQKAGGWAAGGAAKQARGLQRWRKRYGGRERTDAAAAEAPLAVLLGAFESPSVKGLGGTSVRERERARGDVGGGRASAAVRLESTMEHQR